MANLTPVPGWDEIYQLEVTDPVQGGPGGISNRQAQQIANRLELLKGSIINGMFGDRVAEQEIFPGRILLPSTIGKLLLLVDDPSGPYSGLGTVFLPNAADITLAGKDLGIIGLLSLSHSQEVVVEVDGGGNIIGLNKPWQNKVYMGFGMMIFQCLDALTGTWAILASTTSENTIRAGALQLFGTGSGPHPGWLPCDGSTVLKEDHPLLWQAIDTSYGPATLTEFTLPESGTNLDSIAGGTWYIKT